MASVFAVKLLHEAVQRQLDDDTTVPAANVVFGWREAAKQINAASSGLALRVIFEPGDGTETGDIGLGDILPPKHPGRNPRMLLSVGEQVTVYVKARDYSNPTSEAAQYEAARMLFDATVRAIYLSAHGNFEISKARWIRPSRERIDGAEIRFLVTLNAPIPDVAVAIGVPFNSTWPVVGPDGVYDDQVTDTSDPPGDPAEILLTDKINDPPGTTDAIDDIPGTAP